MKGIEFDVTNASAEDKRHNDVIDAWYRRNDALNEERPGRPGSSVSFAGVAGVQISCR